MTRFSTGNEYVSIPGTSAGTGGIEAVGFMHSGLRACIELQGSTEMPLVMPVVEVDGRKIDASHVQGELVSHWVPRFSVPTPEATVRSTVFAPLDRRGFVCALELENHSDKELKIRAGWRGCWKTSYLVTKISRPMAGERFANISGLADGASTVEFRGNTPIFAIAFLPDADMSVRMWDQEAGREISGRSEDALRAQANAPVCYEIAGEFVVAPSETRSIALQIGIGLEEVSAVASAAEMRLQTSDKLLGNLIGWLDSHTIECEDRQLCRMLNVNSFYNYFYAQATTLDKEDFVITSARSMVSDLCGVYRDRDAMRWSLPAVLQINWAQARKMLIYAFTTQMPNVGTCSRFIDGVALEPGLALDQLCAPLRALQMYLQVSGDMSILFDRRIQTGVNTIKDILMVQRNPQTMLFETLLTPSGELARYPYVCFSNVLAWRIMLDLGALYDRIRDLDRVDEANAISNELRAAVQKHFVVEGPNGDMFAKSIDLQGNYELGDDPWGSLKLLTYLGFCTPDDGVYKNTIAWIYSDDNPANRQRDMPVACVISDLLAFQSQEALDLLRRAELDEGIACDWIEAETGRAISGRANAACAGHLAFALRYVLNAFLPEAAAVQKARKPTGTLYTPPPDMDQGSKKARV